MNSTIQHHTESTLADTVADGITVIDFWAGWCGPCQLVEALDRLVGASDGTAAARRAA